MARNYWMMVISPENFEVTRKLGFKVHGLKAHHKRKAQRMEPGDRVLYYIGGKRNFGATATVTSRYLEDHSQTWKNEGVSEWAFKVHIQPEVVLDEDQFMDACQLAPRLDYVRRWAPENWYLAFAQTTMHILPKKDFVLVEQEMRKIKGKNTRHSATAPAGIPWRQGQPAATHSPGLATEHNLTHQEST